MTRVAKFSFVVETRYSYDGINGTGYRGTVTLHVCSAGLPRPPQPVLGLLDRADGMVRAHAERRGAPRPWQRATQRYNGTFHVEFEYEFEFEFEFTVKLRVCSEACSASRDGW